MGHKPNPNNPFPKKTEAAHKATEINAQKIREKTVKSMKYIMAHMPDPCVYSKSVDAKSHDWPVLVGLVPKGRKLTSRDVQKLTMAIVCTNGNATNSWQEYAYVQSFLKALKPFLPSGLTVNADWSNYKKRNVNTSEVKETVAQFEEFVEEYIRKIEVLLATTYVEAGDKYGKAFLEVLSRKFRISGWNTNSTAVRFEGKAELSEDKKTKDDKAKTTSVTFSFETVTPEMKNAEA